jgi:hypothetical protein
MAGSRSTWPPWQSGRDPLRATRTQPSHPAAASDRHRLLLRAALFEGPDARAAWLEWRRAGGDIETVDASMFGLLPLVYRSLEAGGVRDPAMSRLKGVYRHSWVKNQRLLHRVGPALDALQTAGIRTMVLDGAAVTATHYRDVGARPLDDADVLVPPHETKRAMAVLEATGWSTLAGAKPGRVIRSLHVTRLAEPGGGLIDLHRRALLTSVRDDDFWAGAVPVTVGGAATLAPGPTEQLLHACAHGGSARLSWVADASVIIREAGSQIDWARLIEGVAARQLTLRTRASLAVLRDVLDAPIPDRVMAELESLPTGRRERLRFRFASRPDVGPRLVRRAVSLATAARPGA